MEAALGFVALLFIPFIVVLCASMVGTKADRDAGIDTEMDEANGE